MYDEVIPSRKHAYVILTPLKPHFYIVKLGFTGVYIIVLISAQKHRLWVLVRTASSRNMKKYQKFLSENFTIFGGKISVYLNRHVFVMNCTDWPARESRQSLNIALDFYVWRSVRLAQSAVW